MPRINGQTALYGIIGNPVSHSLSPAMHNRAFESLGLNSVYLPFEVSQVEMALDGLRALGVRGASVTIPHKQAVIPFLDSIDPVAAKIGAVNTLSINEKGIHGLNTDWIGANRALGREMSLAGSRVVLLGAGGAARAIGFGLLEEGASLVVASRTPENGQALAARLSCPWLSLDQVRQERAEALINATSVGMSPHEEDCPVSPEILSSFSVVMDIVYAPLETRLLREASKAGCRVINGLAMLLLQGAAQFQHWTGREPPLAVMEEVLTRQLA